MASLLKGDFQQRGFLLLFETDMLRLGNTGGKVLEHIISFGESYSEKNRPFYIEMTGITYPDPNYHIKRTCSEIYCLEYIIGGEGVVQVDNSINHPVKGDLYILPKGCRHDYYSVPENPFEKIWMNINGTLCDELIHVYGLMGVLIVKQIDEVYPIFREFLDICENKELSIDEIHNRCALVFHKLVMTIADRLALEKGRASHSVADEIKAYIDRNIYEHIGVDEIAKHVNLSQSQVNRLFKKNFDVTPYNYILGRKIETAKLLLKNSSLSVKEIAYKLNFADEHYFSNIFLEKVGVRPKNYVDSATE